MLHPPPPPAAPDALQVAPHESPLRQRVYLPTLQVIRHHNALLSWVNHDANSLTQHPSCCHHDRTSISLRAHRTITDDFLWTAGDHSFNKRAPCPADLRPLHTASDWQCGIGN